MDDYFTTQPDIDVANPLDGPMPPAGEPVPPLSGPAQPPLSAMPPVAAPAANVPPATHAVPPTVPPVAPAATVPPVTPPAATMFAQPTITTDLVVATNPKSSFAEAIKAAKTNILFSSIGTDCKTISVTSPESGDGKSFVTANLAVAFAQEGKNVLVIDGDLRRGRQHQIFSLAPTAQNSGYSNLILSYRKADQMGSEMYLNSVIYPTAFQNISVLPAGPTPPNPLELLSSENNRIILDKLRSRYDIIIIDCPPALGLSDALVLSKQCDVNLVVISSAHTKVDQLDSVKKAFAKVESKISGVIINKAVKKGSNYSYYYTDKYYADHAKKESKHER